MAFYPTFVVLYAASLAIAAPAAAASFDCGRATTPRERVICHDESLSELDERLDHLYRDRRSTLSAEGAKLLQESQRSWLHYTAILCPAANAGAADTDSTTSCLTDRYGERLEQLESVGVKIGPYLFNRIDLFAAAPSSDKGTGQFAGFVVHHVAYPRIEAPTSGQAEDWNRRVKKSLPNAEDCGEGNEEMTYNLGFVSQQFISLSWTDSVYCHGTPHGMFSFIRQNLVVSPVVRPLEVEDLFGPSPRWSDKLKVLFDAGLSGTGWTPVNDDVNLSRQEVEDYMMQLENWTFTDDGLQVLFGQGVGGCNACSPPPVTVAWEDLKPLLKQGAVLP